MSLLHQGLLIFFYIPTSLIIPEGGEKRKWNQSKANSSFPKIGALSDNAVTHLHVIAANSKINEQILCMKDKLNQQKQEHPFCFILVLRHRMRLWLAEGKWWEVNGRSFNKDVIGSCPFFSSLPVVKSIFFKAS